jgi:uncharacterized protein
MRTVLVILIMMLPVSVQAAGFNCAKASSAVEKMICGDAETSRLDSDMAAAYKKASAKASDSAPLVADQKSWLKNTRNVCKDIECLKRAYRRRITELKTWNDPAPAGDRDIFGNYQVTRDNYIYNPDTGKDEPAKSTDCLTIKKARDGRIYFSFILVGANGHTCGMEGEAVFRDNAYQAITEGNDPDYPKNCKLKIRVKRNTILLEDPNNGCRELFCGVRASISGVEFGRRQQTQKECQPF